MKYLTRAKKEKPDLPDVFPASKAPIPAKTQNVQEIEAINRFNRANPRKDMAGGGMLVQPGFGGVRQGYKSDSLSTKEFAAKQNIYGTEGLRKLVGPASKELSAYKVFTQALKKAGINFTSSKGEGFPAKFENVNNETIKKFETEVSKLKAKIGLPMSRVETKNIKKQIKIFVQDKIEKGEYVSRPIIKQQFGIEGKSADSLITRSLGINEKAGTGLLKKLGKEEKAEIVRETGKKAGISKLAESDEVLKVINDEFKFDPNISDSEELTKKIYGDEFTKANKKKQLDLILQTDNDVFKYLRLIRGSRGQIPKGLKLPSQEKINDLIDHIETGLEDEAGEGRQAFKKKGFRFSPGILRDYKFALVDEKLGLGLNTLRNERDKFITKGKNLDEIFSLSSSSKYAPGYAEAVQSISPRANAAKETQIDLPLSRILRALNEGRTTMTYKGKKNVSINEAVEDFNKTSKAFAKKYNIRGPKINLGGNFDLKNYTNFRPEAQKNIQQVFKDKKYFLSEIRNKPFETITAKPGPGFEKQLSEGQQISANLRKLGFKCKFAGNSGGLGSCDDPMSYVDDIKKQENLLKVQTSKAPQAVKTLNTARKLNAARSLFTNTLGPGALAFEAVAALPIAYMGYKGGKTPTNILADATYGLLGKSDQRILLDKAIELGYDTSNIKNVQDFYKKSEAFEKQDARANEFMGPDDMFMYPQMVQKAEQDLLSATQKFLTPTGEQIPKKVAGFDQLDLTQQKVFEDQANLAEKRQKQVGGFLQSPIADYLPGLAGGGIAKLAGVDQGPPPESGPNSQGLLSLKNRVRNY